MNVGFFKKLKILFFYYRNTEKGKFELFHYKKLFIYGCILLILIEMTVYLWKNV